MASVDQSSNLPVTQGDEASRAATTAFQKRMMGGDKEALNLNSLRSKAQEMQTALKQITAALQLNAHNIKWQDVLSKFAVVSVQYSGFMEQLRPLLKLWVVHPKSVHQHNATVLPIMLASKPLPDMEAADQQLLQAVSKHFPGGPEAAFEALNNAQEAHNQLVQYLMASSGHKGSGVLDPKGVVRQEVTRQLKGATGTQQAGGGKKRKLEGGHVMLEAVADGRAFRAMRQ